MHANLAPTVNLDFLDGYLFRLLQEIVEQRGVEGSGFFSYYNSRIERKLGGLSELEHQLALYLLAEFADRRVVHAGIGIGTLASALTCNGMKVAGVEYNAPRATSARQIRASLIAVWPEIEQRYEIFQGFFPDCLLSTDWFGQDAVLVFTNVGAGWDDVALDTIIRSMSRYGEVILDLRLFGSVRENENDRNALFDRIATIARSSERLPQIAKGAHMARFSFG